MWYKSDVGALPWCRDMTADSSSDTSGDDSADLLVAWTGVEGGGFACLLLPAGL